MVQSKSVRLRLNREYNAYADINVIESLAQHVSFQSPSYRTKHRISSLSMSDSYTVSVIVLFKDPCNYDQHLKSQKL